MLFSILLKIKKIHILTGRANAVTNTPLLKKYGVARAWVYGSIAQGTANSQSDVDMVVEMPEGHYLGYRLFDLRRELKQALGRRLDLHTPPNAHTNGSVARAIEKTKVLVYSA